MRQATCIRLGFVFLASAVSHGCAAQVLDRQRVIIRQQEIEIARQREELDTLIASTKCVQALESIYKTEKVRVDRNTALVSFKEGMKQCPRPEFAHFRLGCLLRDDGLLEDAATEFEMALGINPQFTAAKVTLDDVRLRLQAKSESM